MYHHRKLTLCMLSIFHAFCGHLSFFQNKLFQKLLSGTLSVSNSEDPDRDWLYIINRIAKLGKYG